MLRSSLSVRRFSSSAAATPLFEFKPKPTSHEAKRLPLLPKAEFAKVLAESQIQAKAKYVQYSDEALNRKIMKCSRAGKLSFLLSALPAKHMSAINASTAVLKAGLLQQQSSPVDAELRSRLLTAVKQHSSSKYNARSVMAIAYGAHKLSQDDEPLTLFANQLIVDTYRATPYVPRPRNNPFSHRVGSPGEENSSSTTTTTTIEILRVVEMMSTMLLPGNVQLRNTIVDDYLCRLKLKQITAQQLVRVAALVVALGPGYSQESNGRDSFLRSIKTELFKRKYRDLGDEDWDVLLGALQKAKLDADDIFDYYALVISTGHEVVRPDFVNKLIAHLSPEKLAQVQ